jgi:uncharacterized protein (DUF1697 family)
MTGSGDPTPAKRPCFVSGLGANVADIKILLLRGVNVSGANRLPMAEFREMLAEFGLKNVDTHVQSGNAVFADPGVEGLESKIGAAMLLRFGFKPALFIMGLEDYRSILTANPYKAAGAVDGTKVHIFFLAAPATGTDLAGLRAHANEGQQVTLTDKALYLHTPAGFGKSTLAEKIPRYLQVPHTARNQRSAESILALATVLTMA